MAAGFREGWMFARFRGGISTLASHSSKFVLNKRVTSQLKVKLPTDIGYDVILNGRVTSSGSVLVVTRYDPSLFLLFHWRTRRANPVTYTIVSLDDNIINVPYCHDCVTMTPVFSGILQVRVGRGLSGRIKPKVRNR